MPNTIEKTKQSTPKLSEERSGEILVIEIPTPRWSTYLAVKHNVPLSKTVPAIIQERAWTSPVWYAPVK